MTWARSGISRPRSFSTARAVGQVVGHGCKVVDAVGEWSDLGVELGFASLLDAGVEVADVGCERDDGFAVDLEHKAEHAVGGWVLRSHVENHGLVGNGVAGVLGVRFFGAFNDVFDVGDEHVGCGEWGHDGRLLLRVVRGSAA